MDYKNGKIYTIRSYQNDKFYIGSTTQPLCKRLAKHKEEFKNWERGKRNYFSSYEIIKLGDAYIELLEEFPCNNKAELNKREGELIRQYKNDVVNIKIEGRSKKEWVADNIEELKQYKHEYDSANIEKIKQYYLANIEELKQYQKEYRLANKEKIKQYNREYRLQQKLLKQNTTEN